MADGREPMAPGAVTLGQEVQRCLGRLAGLPGVTLAALIDGEGFVVASAGSSQTSAEGPAAVSSWLVGALGGNQDLLGLGALRTVLLEHGEGAVLMSPIGSTALLAVMSTDARALDQARRGLHDVLPALEHAL